jgi:AraC-like DNA-binding protein/mannose-6-phosphate isomerase-like protein (cupin superfamily)
MKQYTLDSMINRDENINIFTYVTNDAEPEHTHGFIEIVYIYSGSGQQAVGSNRYDVQRGALLFISTGQTHSFSASGAMQIVNCLISPEFIDRELIGEGNAMEILALSSFEDFEIQSGKMIPMIRFSGKEMLEVEELLERMMEEFTAKAVNYKTALKGYLLVFLTKIFRAMQQADSAEILSHMHRIAPEILQYIEDNYDKKITLPELASRCFYNPSYFSRIFKDYYGKNLTEFIAEKRIAHAHRLLTETSLSVEEISRKVGYQDRKRFYEAYKKIMGVAPGALRGEGALGQAEPQPSKK